MKRSFTALGNFPSLSAVDFMGGSGLVRGRLILVLLVGVGGETEPVGSSFDSSGYISATAFFE